MPGESSGIFGSKPFTNKYYLPVDSKPGKRFLSRKCDKGLNWMFSGFLLDVMRSIQIRHYTKHPAHYNLIVDKTIWDVYPVNNVNCDHDMFLLS